MRSLSITGRTRLSLSMVGRPSRSLTLDQSLALLEAVRESRLNAYVVLSLTVGIRTEEARELHARHLRDQLRRPWTRQPLTRIFAPTRKDVTE